MSYCTKGLGDSQIVRKLAKFDVISMDFECMQPSDQQAMWTALLGQILIRCTWQNCVMILSTGVDFKVKTGRFGPVLYHY